MAQIVSKHGIDSDDVRARSRDVMVRNLAVYFAVFRRNQRKKTKMRRMKQRNVRKLLQKLRNRICLSSHDSKKSQ